MNKKFKDKIGKKMMFYNVKKKEKVTAVVKKIVTKKGRVFAVAKDSDGTPLYRILGKA